MKVLLYILTVLQILSGVFLFFIFITTNAWYYGLIFLFISILQATLTLVVIDNKNRIETVYIGGGTPTTLSAKQLDEIFSELFLCFDFDNIKIITVRNVNRSKVIYFDN